jgi:hypothetical protein
MAFTCHTDKTKARREELEVDIITACANCMANADANDSERSRVFFNYTFSPLLPDRVVPSWQGRYVC